MFQLFVFEVLYCIHTCTCIAISTESGTTTTGSTVQFFKYTTGSNILRVEYRLQTRLHIKLDRDDFAIGIGTCMLYHVSRRCRTAPLTPKTGGGQASRVKAAYTRRPAEF